MAETFEQQAAAFGASGALFGLDIGEKTIGVAVCDPARQVATPVGTVRRKKFTPDAERLKDLAEARRVVGLVIGLPRNMDGTEGPTAAMERDLIALDTSRARRAEKIDEAAAAFILQGAIDRIRGLNL